MKKPARRPRSKSAGLLIVIALCLAACTQQEGVQQRAPSGHGTTKNLTEAEVSRTVAVELMCWEALGPLPQVEPEYTDMENSVAGKIKGIRGFTESDDFHGDGTDWYEFELSTDLVAKLRSTLSGSAAFKKTKPMWYLNEKAPPWWPSQWAADAQCFEKDLIYLVLPDTGCHAWLKRVRT